MNCQNHLHQISLVSHHQTLCCLHKADKTQFAQAAISPRPRDNMNATTSGSLCVVLPKNMEKTFQSIFKERGKGNSFDCIVFE